MKTKKILFMLSAWLLTGAMVFAQNSGAQKGDVNRDGVINESDVPALIKIMRDGGGISESNSAKAAGDLNGDDVVDVADLNALFKIIDNQGTTTEPVYYWYVGQTDPSTMTEISPIVTDKTSPGWRLIGNSIGNYTFETPLYNADENPIVSNPSKNDYWYVALPANSSLSIYNSLKGDEIESGNWNEITNNLTINFVIYKVYKIVATQRKFIGLWVH